jgi:histone acetyltransferase (RNA polymerase elongator complex component)
MHHINIPIFIPELACPFQCIFCNQQKISGQEKLPTENEIRETIITHLATVLPNTIVEIAFFGGSFTGLPLVEQERLLEIPQEFIKKGAVKGIRLSTRPDYISVEILALLKKMKVTAIELGAQSLVDKVLLKSGRGHNAQQVKFASKMILDAEFELGLQMMLGLPGDSERNAILTAQKIVQFGAHTTRIYPTLVIKDTA